ncbi:hypothetical protein BJ165DRAFT_1531878 [Panaeolus papilionaceus]|nr:hypothetical protein BJ165DRAFT_1531878 [Panaeolus papilionaceus]
MCAKVSVLYHRVPNNNSFKSPTFTDYLRQLSNSPTRIFWSPSNVPASGRRSLTSQQAEHPRNGSHIQHQSPYINCRIPSYPISLSQSKSHHHQPNLHLACTTTYLLVIYDTVIPDLFPTEQTSFYSVWFVFVVLAMATTTDILIYSALI